MGLGRRDGNYQIFSEFDPTANAELRFDSSIHQRLFNILLVDLLSPPYAFDLGGISKALSRNARTILHLMIDVSENPVLNPSGSELISLPLAEFVTWLDTFFSVDHVWFPSIELETSLRLKRVDFIKLCGNIAKHSSLRLTGVMGQLIKMFKNNGIDLIKEDAYRVIPEFYEWFHRDIFNYHSSTIAEFLNNVRWGIYEYLKPEFARSFTRDDSIMYHFLYPENCTQPLVRTMYWDLMNDVRTKPYFPRFSVTQHLKGRY